MFRNSSITKLNKMRSNNKNLLRMCKTKFQYVLWILLIGVSMIACQQAGEPNAKNESEFKALSADTEFDLVIINVLVMDP